MKLYIIHVELSVKNADVKVVECDAVEKNKTVVLTWLDRYQEQQTRHIKKEKIGVVTSGVFFDRTSEIYRQVICTKEEIENQTNRCWDFIKQLVDQYYNDVIKMLANYETRNKKK